AFFFHAEDGIRDFRVTGVQTCALPISSMSLDGFIAGPDDAMDWVFEYVTAGDAADDVMASTGAMLGGRRGYDVARRDSGKPSGEAFGGAWSGTGLVLTHRPPEDDPDTVFLSGGGRSGRARVPHGGLPGRAAALLGGPAGGDAPAVDRDDHRGVRLRVGDHPHRQPEGFLHQLVGDDLGRVALGDDAAVLHHDEVGGVAARVVEVVQHRHQRVVPVGVQLGAEVEDVDLVRDVQV